MAAARFVLRFTTALTLLGWPLPGSAQHPAGAYWSGLESAGSADEAESVPVPHDLDRDLALGMLQGRVYELTGRRSAAYRGRGLLERAVARNRSDAWTHFALGALLARGPDARQREREDRAAMFVDEHSLAFGGAVRALRGALERDPELTAAAEELIRLGLDSRDAVLAGEGARAFRAPDTTPDQHLLLATVARLQGEAAAAAALVERARAAGADAAVAAHAEAEALFLVRGRERQAEAAYLAGTRTLTAAGATVYWRGLALIAEPVEAADWGRTPPGERGPWIRRFWELRAARAGVPLGERLATHFRRVHEASTRYPLVSGMRGELALQEMTLGFDPRDFGVSLQGLMLVRHGDPDRLRALYTACSRGIPYFKEREGARDAPDAFVTRQDDMAQRMAALGMDADLRVSCRPSAPGVGAAQARRVMRMLVAHDSYTPRLEAQLAFAGALYAFRGSAGGTDVVAALTLPAAGMRVLADGATAVLADLAVVLIDERAQRADRSDTRVELALPEAIRRPGGPSLLSLIQAELATTLSGPVSFRILLRDTTGSRAGGSLAGELLLPSLAPGDAPQLSDLMLAPLNARGTWRRGAVALSPAPGKAHPVGEDLQLFYEIYDLVEGAPFRTEILLAPQAEGLWSAARRLLGAARNVVHVQFSEVAGASHPRYGLQALRTLGTRDLAPGRYRVEVRTSDERTGKTATRTRLIEIGSS